jgi:hypothetical protein
MDFVLRVDRVRGLMTAKGLKRKALTDAGLTEAQYREWISRKQDRRVAPSGFGLVTMALVLQTQPEWLMGAPSRYDEFGEDYRRIAIEGSLNFFLEQTPEGRRISPDLIPRLRDEITSADPPLTAFRWQARAETIIRAARWGQARDQVLNQMVEPPSQRNDEP